MIIFIVDDRLFDVFVVFGEVATFIVDILVCGEDVEEVGGLENADDLIAQDIGGGAYMHEFEGCAIDLLDFEVFV